MADSRAQSCEAFKHQRTAPSRICTEYLRDVTFGNLLFTNRNVGFYTDHDHLSKAQDRLRNHLRQAFCTECTDAACFVNVHMVRTILVHMHYIHLVSYSFILVDNWSQFWFVDLDTARFN